VIDSRINRKWLALELKRALAQGTLTVCGPRDCHGCAPFARDCVSGLVAQTTGRPLDPATPLLSTPTAPGPGLPAARSAAPPLGPREGGAPATPEGEGMRLRYRGRFTKSGRLRFLGHLDLTRMLLRALRRAGVPLVYSRGFNPKPRVSFSPALSMGVASEAEYLDFEVHEALDPLEALERINAKLPAGARFTSLRDIARGAPSVGEGVRAARYRADALADRDPRAAVAGFRDRGSRRIELERKGRRQAFDLDEELLTLEALDGGALRFTLAVRAEGASIRPDEALHAILGERPRGVRLVREDVLVDWNGRLVDPLLAAAAS
jgi:radical SAM-linked protein